MSAPQFKNKAEAKAAGYVVDTCCYPWVAYQGPRFAPTVWSEVPTDTEAELQAAAEQYVADIFTANAQRDAACFRVAELEAGLRTLIRAYVSTLEIGRDRIVMLGGQCDSLEQMEREDPHLRAARALLSPSAEPRT